LRSRWGNLRGVPSHQRVSIYGRSDGVYVASDDRTIDGFYVIGAAQRLAADADDDALGLAILSALDRSRDGVPTPGPGVAVADSLVSLSSSRTWHSFAKAAVLVGVSLFSLSVHNCRSVRPMPPRDGKNVSGHSVAVDSPTRALASAIEPIRAS
jgi:hypothetical protein